MIHTKINLLTALKLHTSNKDFILFNVDANNNITNYKLTNDLQRYRYKYTNFRLLEVVKQQTELLTIM